ncbi:TIGR03619 family F420-dependent LLM class oxidoreductase [Nocardiopsis sediminis]|uniref:TIGR03619 family F420-dependent LLM class oxidoreductase n=1 Tax=Nocardiopsis sediminis TaxID=1778267 RepID=A0ABV8FN24_9ACTN
MTATATPVLDAVLPTESATLDPWAVVGLARRAEELGYRSVWLPDHPLPPHGYGNGYGGALEPMVLLTAIAAATERIGVGTSVLILPLRDPFLLAKQAATLDRLAPGRLTLGVGTGWEAREFAALGADFADRGGRTDEALRLIRHLHTAGRGPFTGDRYGFTTGVFAPVPAAPVPIMVGGTSAPALRRAARHADVWQGVALDPDGFAERAAAVREMAGRPIGAGTRTELLPGGSAAEVAETVRAFTRAGADHVAVWFGPEEGFAGRMADLAREAGIAPEG